MSVTSSLSIRFVLRALAAACALSAAACGDDHGHDDCDEEDDGHAHGGPGGCGLQENCTDTVDLVEGLRVTSEDGEFTVEVIAHRPLAIENNELTIAIEDADGEEVADAELEVDVFSVDCLHGGPVAPATVRAGDDDRYLLEPVHAHGGPWDTVIAIEAGGVRDTARLHFCVPGEEHGDGGAPPAQAPHCH